MEHDSQTRADLVFSLSLPESMKDAIAYKSGLKGYDTDVLFEGSRPHAYLRTLALMTSVYMDTIKLVHFDGELLHIFMQKEFPRPKLSVMRRIFDTVRYLPDSCLHDILTDDQANFCTHERTPEGLLVSEYSVSPYEGPVDVTYLESHIRDANHPIDQLCSVVLQVNFVEETLYEGDDCALAYVVQANKEIEAIDFYALAVRNNKDMLFASREIAKIERYFNKTKFKAGKTARR